MPELGGDMESVEIDAGADDGDLEVIEAEEVAEELHGVSLRCDVQRSLTGLRLRGRQGGARVLETLDDAPDGVDVPRPDGLEEGLLQRAQPQIHGERSKSTLPNVRSIELKAWLLSRSRRGEM